MSPKKRGHNRRRTQRFVNEELAFRNEMVEDYQEQRTVFENFQYLSPNEKLKVESKFSKPRNATQWKYVRELEKKTNKIILATGPAGTGKTLFGTEYGIKHFLMGDFEKLIFTRPAVSADEDLGYLPGTLEDKMAPWVRPIYDILHTFVSPSEVTQLLESKSIEIAPLAYMRGRTFKNTWIVADECQNTNVNQFKMLLTRIGENSRMVITGDLDQHDRHDEVNGLADFLEKLHRGRSKSISNIEFGKDDIEREEVIKDVLDIYNGYGSFNIENDEDDESIGLLSISPESDISVLESIMEEKHKYDNNETDGYEDCEYKSESEESEESEESVAVSIQSKAYINVGLALRGDNSNV
jgi:phosphate starvation-inducible PhoH-like protein